MQVRFYCPLVGAESEPEALSGAVQTKQPNCSSLEVVLV